MPTDASTHVLIAAALTGLVVAGPAVAEGALVADCSLADWLPVSTRMLVTTLLRFVFEIAELARLLA